MHEVGWQLKGHEATLSCGPLAGRIDLHRPDRGLMATTLKGRPIGDCRILNVEIPNVGNLSIKSPAAGAPDFYQRGADLVATYPSTEEWPFRTQLYWRGGYRAGALDAAVVELVVSVQTNLLDSQPQLAAGSNLGGSDLLQLADPAEGRFLAWEPTRQANILQRSAANPCSCTLLRLPDGQGSYVEMVHPLDFGRTEICGVGVTESGEARLWSFKHTLFAETLEKGVILRSRVLGAFVGREADEEQAASLYREFANSEPPLTT